MNNTTIFKSAEGKNAILAYYTTILSRWPVTYEALTIPTHLGNTFIIACGDPANPPLFLLHGSSSNAAIWIGDVSQLITRYRVYAVDIPGEPGKSEPARPALTGPAYSEWLKEIFTALGIQHAVLAGISLGGWLATKFAVAYPDQVDKLALLCPSGIAPQRKSFLLMAVPLLFLGQWGIDRVADIINGNQTVPEEAMNYTRLIASQFTPRLEVIPIFTDKELKQLRMPVVLFAGEKDALLNSQKTAQRLESLLPNVTIHLLPGVGHLLINLTTPMMAFLSSKTEKMYD